jgi:hypothetical protein
MLNPESNPKSPCSSPLVWKTLPDVITPIGITIQLAVLLGLIHTVALAIIPVSEEPSPNVTENM